MQSITNRTRRLVAHTASFFHQVRVQGYQRDNAVCNKGATDSQVHAAYFAPTLQSICADVLAHSFDLVPEIDELRESHPDLYDMVVDRLPVDDAELPLRVRVTRVVHEGYWRRCCEARWSLGQLSKMANERLAGKEYGWKRLYLEHVLSDLLMSLRGSGPSEAGGRVAPSSVPPVITDEQAASLAELCATCRDYIQAVHLPCQFVHMDLYEHLLSKLPGVLTLRLTYGASDAAVGCSRAMMGFGEDDAEGVRVLLRMYPPLQCLRLPSNRLADAGAKVICSGLVGHTTLCVLDLSHNSLRDAAAEALALVLFQPDLPLEELYLQDNGIGGDGAMALATMLEANKTLRVLDISQNRIPDAEGGDALVRALPHHPTLSELRMSSNHLGRETVVALSEVLPQVTTLTSLTLSGNRLLGGNVPVATHVGIAPSTGRIGVVSETSVDVGGDGGAPAASENGPILCRAVASNFSMQFIDVRQCGLSSGEVAEIERLVAHRVQAIRAGELRTREAEVFATIRARTGRPALWGDGAASGR